MKTSAIKKIRAKKQKRFNAHPCLQLKRKIMLKNLQVKKRERKK